MKRSTINHLIKEAIEFFKANKFSLPSWGFWSPEDWQKK